MDPTSTPVNPAELYELLGIIGGVVVSGLLGWLLVRRARAARQRHDRSGRRGPGAAPARASASARRSTPEPEAEEPEARRRARGGAEPAAPPARRARPARRRRAGAGARARAPARAGHPVPAARARARKGAALAPGLARTRSGFIARLGEIFAGKKQLDPVGRRRDREGAADRGHRRPHQPEAARGDPQLAVAPGARRSGRGVGVPAPTRDRDAVAAGAARSTSHRRSRSCC